MKKVEPLWQQPSPHPFLLRHLPDLLGDDADLAKQSKSVLVPLCGKSVDMAHLQQLGCSVLGVEQIDLPIHQFRAATSDKYEWLDPRWDKSGVRHAIAPKGGEASLEVIEGDFYKLEARDDLEGKFDLCLDRAALTYMPPRVQTQHVAQLKHLLKRGGRMLLMTLEFDGEPLCVCKVKSPDGAGPPWSIREADVHRLFDDDFTVQHLCRESIVGQDPRWEKAKGFKVRVRVWMDRWH